MKMISDPNLIAPMALLCLLAAIGGLLLCLAGEGEPAAGPGPSDGAPPSPPLAGPEFRHTGTLQGLRPEDVRLEVSKAARRLDVFVRGRIFKRYRIALGRSPKGDKEVEGDGRTPEGEFYVCQKLAAGRYGPSLGLSYPNAEDAERGRRAGLIDDAQRRAILESLAARRRPPWDTPLGGAICIHGRGSSGDWTAGCIALDDADADELFALTPMGAAVLISASATDGHR